MSLLGAYDVSVSLFASGAKTLLLPPPTAGLSPALPARNLECRPKVQALLPRQKPISLLPTGHQRNEIIEQISRVVRARRRLRMILHAEKRQRTVAHAFVRVVVQIYVRDFHIARWQRLRVHAKPMIL